MLKVPSAVGRAVYVTRRHRPVRRVVRKDDDRGIARWFAVGGRHAPGDAADLLRQHELQVANLGSERGQIEWCIGDLAIADTDCVEHPSPGQIHHAEDERAGDARIEQSNRCPHLAVALWAAKRSLGAVSG